MKRMMRVLAVAATACILSGCSAASVTDTVLVDGTAARLYRKEDGTASITTLAEEEKGGYCLVTKTSVTGQDTGEGIEYTTWYLIQTYQPLSDSEEDVRLAAQAFDDAKTDPAWQSEDPVSSRKTGSVQEDGYTLSYNDETRTFAWEYTLGEPALLDYNVTEDEFAFEPIQQKEAAE